MELYEYDDNIGVAANNCVRIAVNYRFDNGSYHCARVDEKCDDLL